jgi:hypothetical protein
MACTERAGEASEIEASNKGSKQKQPQSQAQAGPCNLPVSSVERHVSFPHLKRLEKKAKTQEHWRQPPTLLTFWADLLTHRVVPTLDHCMWRF